MSHRLLEDTPVLVSMKDLWRCELFKYTKVMIVFLSFYFCKQMNIKYPIEIGSYAFLL